MRIAALLACVWLTPSAAFASARYDPALRFRSIETPHFVIHYHQGEEAPALRLAQVAEDEHADLAARFGYAPHGRTHVVLVDQDDDSNGWSTPLPYNEIEITAAPPGGVESIGNTSDWLRIAFRHEYTHTLHLDQARGWAHVARRVFGRAAFAFPNLTTPEWQVEGLATYVESRGGEGRLPAGPFRTILDDAARAGRLAPLDRLNGGLVTWPGPDGWYAYGGYFHAYLASRFGRDRVAALAQRTAGRAPYLTAGAFESVFGESLGTLWRQFERDWMSGLRSPQTPAGIVRRTHTGFSTDGPRFDRDAALLYTRRDPHGFPALERLTADDRTAVRLTDRLGGRQVAPGRAAIYFDRLQYVRSTGLVSDLYRFDRVSHAVRRLTRGARLSEPDLSPDERYLAALETRGGVRRLVVLDRAALEAGTGVEGSLVYRAAQVDVTMGAPRWSPDGHVIAIEARRLHGPSEVVVVEPSTGRTTPIATSSRGRNITPAWMPDGRALVFASDRDGGPFNLYRVAWAPAARTESIAERLTHLDSGARSPDISADGRTLAFVGRTVDGDDVFTMPLEDRRDDSRDFTTPVPHPPRSRGESTTIAHDGDASRLAGDDGGGARAPIGATSMAPLKLASRPYSPWPSVWPRAWLPIVTTGNDELRVGAAVAGIDALAYHTWTAQATWSAARRPELDPVSPGARPDYVVAYAYDRWRPTFVAAFADETTPRLLPASSGRSAQAIASRERSAQAGVAIVSRRVRSAWQALALYRIEHDTIVGLARDVRFDRGALRLGAAFDSRERYGYSIGPERGVLGGVSTELASSALGGDGRATLARADIRGFVPVRPQHAVLALRATMAASTGDAATRRVLRLGGAGPDAGGISFSEDASSLLRAFPPNAFAGGRVVLANAEYRVPLWWVERGYGTWPLFLRALHAGAFVDAGHAWSDRPRLSDAKVAWGGELSADTVAGFVLPVSVTAGVAWGHDGAGIYRHPRQAYVRVGYGF